MRIAQALDHHIQNTQYGFRLARSCIQAIHTIIRHMDKAERKGANLGIILLDWEEAFDKISHTRAQTIQYATHDTQPNRTHLR